MLCACIVVIPIGVKTFITPLFMYRFSWNFKGSWERYISSFYKKFIRKFQLWFFSAIFVHPSRVCPVHPSRRPRGRKICAASPSDARGLLKIYHLKLDKICYNIYAPYFCAINSLDRIWVQSWNFKIRFSILSIRHDFIFHPRARSTKHSTKVLTFFNRRRRPAPASFYRFRLVQTGRF